VIRHSPPRILALAPEGLNGLRVAIAACRASALGIVDLCTVRHDGWMEAFRQFSGLTSGPKRPT